MVQSEGQGALTLPRLAAIAVVSFMIGGTVTACARQPANSGGRDADPSYTLRDDDLAAASVKWRANAEAQRARAAGLPPNSCCGSAAGPTNSSEALMEAVQLGDAKLVKSLLARGADRRTLNDALLLTARSEPLTETSDGREDKDAGRPYAEVAKMLLGRGSSVEARDRDGSTPLITAAGYGETAVVKLLLDRGAKIEATDNDGRTPLIAAACMCPIIDMPDTDDSVRLLLEHGADIEAKEQGGGTALMAAAGWGRDLIVQILLDGGAQIDARDDDGNTALLIAAKGSGYPTADAVQVLLARGADIEARNNNGDTALMLAASGRGSEDAKIVKILLQRGADVRLRDKRGRTALDLAVGTGRAETVSLLRAAAGKPR